MTMEPGAPNLRLLHFAILTGAVAFAVVVAVLTETQGALGGETPSELRSVALAYGVLVLPATLLLRRTLRQRAETAEGSQRTKRQTAAVLVPVAMLEGAILLQLVVWLLTAEPMPSALVAGVLLLVGVAIAPPAPAPAPE